MPALDAAWQAAHPTATLPLVAFNIDDDDDGMPMWRNDRSPEASDFAKDFLLHNSGSGVDINGQPKPYTHAALDKVFAGPAVADYFDMQPGDPRLAEVFGISQYGVVFTSGTKIAEDGGANPQDRDVPPGGQRRPHRPPSGSRRYGGDYPNRSNHPQSPRPSPGQPASRATRAHGRPARGLPISSVLTRSLAHR